MKGQHLRTTIRRNINTTFILLGIWFMLLPGSTVAQQYFIKSYGVENGLPTRIISDACQDKNGFMWFSTYSGISKYDGFSFTNYDSVNGLPALHFRKIKCDEKGIIWAVPYSNTGKVVFLRDTTWKTIDLPFRKMPYSYITSFDVTYRNNSLILCIGSYTGIDVFQHNTWKHFDISADKLKNRVYSITKKGNSFYLCTAEGLCIFNGETLDWSLNAEINPKKEIILAVSFEKPGLPWERMWILSVNSISYLQNKKITRLPEKFLLEDIDVAHFPFIGIRKGGDLIFGNNFSKYLLKITENKIIPLRIKNGFMSNGASSIFIDREENIWITDSRGINKLSNVSLVNYFETSGMPENEVTAIVETNDGRFVLGHNNQISILHDDKFKVIPFPGVQSSLTRVLDLLNDKSGNVWISANNLGIGRLMSNEKIKWYPLVKNTMVNSVCQDNEGRIWFGTNRNLYYLKNDKIVEFEHNNLLRGGERKIYPSFKGGIYITTMTGLWHADKNGAVRLQVDSENQDLNAFAYFRDNNGTEFIGTMNGLYYINTRGKIARFAKHGFNITNPVYFILQDRDKSYWFGTNNGVIKWDGINEPEVFNTLNGLAGRETNRSAGLLDSKGRIWVGTDRGLSCFSSDAERLKTPPPTVQLLYTETTHGEFYPLNESSSVSSTNNSLTFHFRGVSYVNEELITYKYKLNNYDKDWREATQVMLDKIKYVNLKPGKYNLCVMAKNNTGSWSKTFCSADIIVRPPFFLTWWFIFIILIGTFGFLMIFYKIASQQLVNKTLKKEISERKLAEESLKESEQRLSFVLEGSRLGTWDWDLVSNVIYRNHLCSEIIGYTAEETGTSPEFWMDLIHPEDRELNKEKLRLHLEGKTSLLEIEYRILTKDKQYKWIQDKAMVVQRDAIGKALRMSGTLTDITEKKHVADTLQKSEERLRLLLGSLPVAIYISPVSAAIDLTMITGNVKNLTGFTEEDFLSVPDFWRSRIHPYDLRRVMDAFKMAPEQGGLTVEYRWRHADGTYKWFHDQTILKTYGSSQEYMGVFVDINDRKLAEQEIKNKNEQLNHLNAEKDKLFSIISHDLRSPVNGFLGLTSILAEELELLTKDQLRDIASSLYHSASKVNDLLNDLLEWSRLQRGLTVFEPVPVIVKQVTDGCISMINEQAKTKFIEINSEIPADMEICADIYMIRLVVRNLLTNAVKFTPKGGRISISAISEKGKFAKISIRDTGIGMSPELNRKLFKVNEKTSRKGTEGEPSSGLGLILCKEFVEKQNGSIWAESEEGKGSIFHFTIPLET